jgi:hypothetical protein
MFEGVAHESGKPRISYVVYIESPKKMSMIFIVFLQTCKTLRVHYCSVRMISPLLCGVTIEEPPHGVRQRFEPRVD